MKFSTKVIGSGSAFPKTRMTNFDIESRLAGLNIETSDKWITERTGISERRHSDPSDPDEFNAALGSKAALKALEMAGRSAEDIDLILYATCSADTPIPSSACWLQERIGARNAWATDLNAACSGFIYGLSMADQYIQTGHSKTVLVVGAEVLNHYIDWQDRSSCILFGDGAGAFILERTDFNADRRILSSHMRSDGRLWKLLNVPAGGSRLPITVNEIEKKLNKLDMNGREIFKTAVRTLEEFAREALEKNNIRLDDLDWFVPHQANRRIIDAVAQRLNLPKEKVIINLDRYGNTSAATIPTAFDEAVRSGRIQKGQTVLMDAFGGGLTFGSILLRW